MREGSLEAPQRHPIDWQSDEFNDETSLFQELERVYDICHGCRRCFSLCNAFPTLFDAIDDSDTMELDGVAKDKYWDVVDNCYLCDLCFMTKCPYVPPHEWQVDFPHLMLRAKIVGHQKGRVKFRDKVLSSTDKVGKLASIPVAFNAINAAGRNKLARAGIERTLGVHRDANLPSYCSSGVHRELSNHRPLDSEPVKVGPTNGKVALFASCYGKHNSPTMNEDLVAVFEHNGIPVQIVKNEQCCGMPKLEIGDMAAVTRLKDNNIKQLSQLVNEGWDIITPIPSCTLMFRQELPLLYNNDESVKRVGDAMYDPFEYLMLRHRHGLLNTEFSQTLGSVVYHAACHQRVQNVGSKTRQALELVPDTKITTVERCSGHDGTYAVKKEFYEFSKKIVRPITNQVNKTKPDHVASDCVLAGAHIAKHSGDDSITAAHPITLLRTAYGI